MVRHVKKYGYDLFKYVVDVGKLGKVVGVLIPRIIFLYHRKKTK